MVTAAQAAQMLSVSTATITRLVRDGRLPNMAPINPVLRKQRLLFKKSDVERLARGE